MFPERPLSCLNPPCRYSLVSCGHSNNLQNSPSPVPEDCGFLFFLANQLKTSSALLMLISISFFRSYWVSLASYFAFCSSEARTPPQSLILVLKPQHMIARVQKEGSVSLAFPAGSRWPGPNPPGANGTGPGG